MADPKDVAAWATIALGATQLLSPQTAAKVFGLDELDDQAVWLTRLLGSSYVTIGAIELNPAMRDIGKPISLASLAGTAAVTLMSSSRVPKRTVVMVLGFVGGLAAALARD